MKKSWSVIKSSYINALAFRSEIVLWLFLHVIPLVTIFAIWNSIYSNQNEIRGYSLTMILQYYFMTSLIDSFTSTHFESWRVKEIREGKIDFLLIRPLQYIQELFLRDIGGKALYLTLALPFFLVLFVIISTQSGLTFPNASIFQWSIFFGLLTVGYIVQFLAATIVVLSGFWLEYAEGGEHFKFVLLSLFGGWMIPIPMMPAWLQQIVNFLPLKYAFAKPIGIIQNTDKLAISDIVYIAAFLLFLWAIVQILWRKARYQYSSHGG
ncbi:ABC-2 family transporter protein [Patescibacteria group bacterium]|nr:ABC-2 family transporter protein [Patescibacteria group bacterium]